MSNVYVLFVQANVEGDKCDICKAGHFNLQLENSAGCSECYCSGVSSICEPASLIYRTVSSYFIFSTDRTFTFIINTAFRWKVARLKKHGFVGVFRFILIRS